MKDSVTSTEICSDHDKKTERTRWNKNHLTRASVYRVFALTFCTW